MPKLSSLFVAAALTMSIHVAASPLIGGEWSVPLAGNAFHQAPPSGRQLPISDGALRISGGETYCVYFHMDRPGKVELAITGRASDGKAEVQARVDDQELTAQVTDTEFHPYPLGPVTIAEPGYVRVDFQISATDASAIAEVSDLIVRSDVADLQVDYVQNNQGNMFYWGRRGPSVHLQYQLPRNTPLTYAYSEITVPKGQDAIGSYFMANGFGEGYFGMQVNSDSERRVLFSVWSPFQTDNPADIPPEERIVTLAKGTDVRAQEFGNEGSGGQSFMVYPWQAGSTYRFLTEVKPDGDGNTQYTSWFGEKKSGAWQLIASFRRPKTDKHLTGFHSFLENFNPEYGSMQRSAHYENQWVCDTSGTWHEIAAAKLTGDNTARARQRLDYAGGAEQSHFFLRNCGFFNDRVPLDETFERSQGGKQPSIDLDALPRD